MRGRGKAKRRIAGARLGPAQRRQGKALKRMAVAKPRYHRPTRASREFLRMLALSWAGIYTGPIDVELMQKILDKGWVVRVDSGWFLKSFHFFLDWGYRRE